MYQSGFRTNHLFTVELVDLFLTGMEKKMHTGIILVDQKAFDALDHGVLLEKMKYFGFPISIIE